MFVYKCVTRAILHSYNNKSERKYESNKAVKSTSTNLDATWISSKNLFFEAGSSVLVQGKKFYSSFSTSLWLNLVSFKRDPCASPVYIFRIALN